VNRVFPNTADGEFMRSRLEQQSEYLEEIEDRFDRKQIIHVEQEARDVTERVQLDPIARQLDKAGLG
ncbi:MAG: ArsA-related P-loop ATPase, partial [Rubrobacteraceae bacterium]